MRSTALLLFFIVISSYGFAQNRTQPITMYDVVLRTKSGKIKGIFERNDGEYLFIGTRNGDYLPVKIEDIQEINILKPLKTRKSNDLPLTPDALIPLDYDLNGNLIYDPSAVWLSLAGTAAEVAFDYSAKGLRHLFRKKLESFTINGNPSKYYNQILDISNYSLFYQIAPQYEIELLHKLATPVAAEK